MPHKNVELAVAAFDALTSGDPAQAIAIADPEVKWYSFFAELRVGGAYRGHEGTRQYVSDLAEAWDDVGADVDESIGIGDLALLVGRIRYRGKASGAESGEPVVWLFKFRDGKVLCFHAFREPERVLESLGHGTG